MKTIVKEKKPRGVGLGFTLQSQKCFKIKAKNAAFLIHVQHQQSTQDLRGELNLLRRMEMATENFATMASDHFYESICMAHYQEPPTPDLQPQLYILLTGGTECKFTVVFRRTKMTHSC